MPGVRQRITSATSQRLHVSDIEEILILNLGDVNPTGVEVFLGARGMVPRFRGGGAPMRVVCLMLVLAAVVSIASGSAAAANYAQESLDQYFRVEYQVERRAARRQRLRIQHAPWAASRSHAAQHRSP